MAGSSQLFEIRGIDPCELDRALVARGGLAQFVKLAWSQVEPSRLVWEPHLDLMCAHYEAVSRGECRELVTNVPPGGSKSSITNVFWPTWDWLANPWRRWIFTSYSQELTLRDAQKAQALIQSEWFQKRWGYLADPKALARWGLHPLGLGFAGQAKGKVGTKLFYTTSGGMRFSTMFGGAVTGFHAHILVADDPIKPADIQNGGDQARAALDKVNTRWVQTFSSRSADPATFARVIIMQRLHEEDLAGQAVKAGATHLRLPMEYEPENHCKTPWGEDWRTQPGELLAPKRFPQFVVQERKEKTPSRDWAAQYQQSPSPEAGAIFRREWFGRRWSALPSGISLIQSWDCTFKDSVNSDFVVGQVWGRKGAEYYLVDQVRGRWDLTATCQAMVDLSRKWPGARSKLVEDKANGPAVYQTLRRTLGGIVLVNPQGGKVARANAVEPYWRAGNVILPDAPWVSDFVEEHVRFPVAAHDDQVDAGSQALIWFEGNSSSKLKAAMENAFR